MKAKTEKNSKLDHISDKDLEILISQYYIGENIYKLINEYNIDTVPSKLLSLFPDKLELSIICEHCNSPMYLKRESRGLKNSSSIYICSSCEHSNRSFCRCVNCEINRKKEIAYKNEQREILLKIKATKLQSFYKEINSKLNPIINIDELSDLNKIYISTIIHSQTNQKEEADLPHLNFNVLFMPTEDTSILIIKSLVYDNILLIDPTSCEKEFSDDDFNVFNHKNIKYRFNFEKSSYQKIHNQLNLCDYKISLDCAYQLWRQVSSLEAINYLAQSLEKLRFPSNLTSSNFSRFEAYLDNFSVSQIYTIIYSATSRAAREYQANDITKKHARNVALHHCEWYVNNAINNKWEVSHYKGAHLLNLSCISDFYFYEFLGIGDQCLYLKPSVSILKALPRIIL